MSVILGIDPGSRRTGYGLVRVEGRRLSYLASGCIHLQADSLPGRLQTLHCALETLLGEHRPDDSAMEQVFFGKNANSALKLGHARGVAMLSLALAGLSVFEYSPRVVKQAVTGSGAAEKDQVQAMVMRLLNLSQRPGEDAADALAVAICHAFSLGYRQHLASPGSGF